MPDTAIPIFQTVNEKGEAVLEVEAIIRALGLKLTESEVSTLASSIVWERENVNHVGISGLISPPSKTHTPIHRMRLVSGEDVTTGEIEPEAEGSAELQLKANNGEPSQAMLRATANLGKANVWGSGETSRFLQIVTSTIARPESWFCNFGTSSFTWPGAASEVIFSVSHGLGFPAVMAFGASSFPNVIINWNFETSSTTFNLRARDIDGAPAAGTKNGFTWFAIG